MHEEKKILLAHGGGGKLTKELIDKIFLPHFSNPLLLPLEDSAVFPLNDFKIAFTTDAYTIDPPFFPGGDIGMLSIYGTVNDLSMMGATPLYIASAFILEEGFPLKDLERIAESMHKACEVAGVKIITGDTKVVGAGMADKIFIATAGIGVLPKALSLSPQNIKPGDQIIINGTIGDHGIAVMMQREGIGLAGTIQSDAHPLNKVVERILPLGGIRFMRDLTRGGLGGILCEVAQATGYCLYIEEGKIPIKEEVLSACEILGLDPLYVANEGKFIAIVSPDKADEILKVMRGMGEEAEIIGRVEKSPTGTVILETSVGGKRLVEMPLGEELPRIC